jgi:hypothetical protein
MLAHLLNRTVGCVFMRHRLAEFCAAAGGFAAALPTGAALRFKNKRSIGWRVRIPAIDTILPS